MDFREVYKNSAETLSPDKQTVERMKTAVLQQAGAPTKAFPFKRLAYIGGTVAACLVIAVVGVSVLRGRDTSSITEAAQELNSSIAADDVAPESAAVNEDSAEETDADIILDTGDHAVFGTTTVAVKDSLTIADTAADTYDNAAAEDAYDEPGHFEEPSINIVPPEDAPVEEPAMTDLLPEEAPADEIDEESEAEIPVEDVDTSLDEPPSLPEMPAGTEVDTSTDTPEEPAMEEYEQILFSADMEYCTIRDVTYRSAHMDEEFVPSLDMIPEVFISESYELYDVMIIGYHVLIYKDNKFVDCYYKEDEEVSDDPVTFEESISIEKFTEQIQFNPDMDTCTLFGITYHRTEEPVDAEEFESVNIVTESGKYGEAILIMDKTIVTVYIEGEYIGTYIK